MRRAHFSQDTLLALIELAYAAAEDAQRWQEFLAALSEAVAATGALLMHHDLLRQGHVVASVRIDPLAIQAYNDTWHRQDPWALSPAAATLTVPGRVIHEEQLLPHTELRRSDYYNEFSRPNRVSRLMTASLLKDTESLAALSIYRSEVDEPFGEAELGFFQALTPHVQRSLLVHRQLQGAFAGRDAALAATDRLPIGVLGLDRSARVVFANEAARRIAEAEDGLSIRDAALVAATPSHTVRLRSAIKASLDLASGATVASAPVALRLERPSGRAAYEVCVTPRYASDPTPLAGNTVAVLLFLREPDVTPTLDEEHLRVFFGFTPAEARFAACLAKGDTPQEIGERLGLTRSTTRWMLEQVRHKTGAHTQAQAVASLLTSLAMLQPLV